MSFRTHPELIELASRAPGRSQSRLVLLTLLAGVAAYVAVLGVAEAPVSPALGIVEIQSAGLAITGLLTGLMLIGQMQLRRSPALAILAFGYLFSSAAACAYTLLFPEFISLFQSISSRQANDWQIGRAHV